MGDQRFRTGEALPPQRELAHTLGVSRATLREAVSILATAGMLSIEQGRGTYVLSSETARGLPAQWRFAARYSPDEVYQFRYIAESHAAQLAAMSRADADISEINLNLDRMRESIRSGDLERYSQADFDFHALIMDLSGNRLLADMHRGFSSVLIESQRLPLVDRGRLWEPVFEHEKIVEALVRCDPEGARYYMRQHLSRACNRAGIRLVEVD